jgi:hypothetical protein
MQANHFKYGIKNDLKINKKDFIIINLVVKVNSLYV